MFRKLVGSLKNFYVVTGGLFLIWMLFLDANNFISVYSLNARLRALENEREYYTEKKEEVMKDHEELFGNRKTLEKFARENFLMKKDTEDVFVVVEED